MQGGYIQTLKNACEMARYYSDHFAAAWLAA